MVADSLSPRSNSIEIYRLASTRSENALMAGSKISETFNNMPPGAKLGQHLRDTSRSSPRRWQHESDPPDRKLSDLPPEVDLFNRRDRRSLCDLQDLRLLMVDRGLRVLLGLDDRMLFSGGEAMSDLDLRVAYTVRLNAIYPGSIEYLTPEQLEEEGANHE